MQFQLFALEEEKEEEEETDNKLKLLGKENLVHGKRPGTK